MIPPSGSVLTIGTTGSAAPGSYSIEVSGTSTTGIKTRNRSTSTCSTRPRVR